MPQKEWRTMLIVTLFYPFVFLLSITYQKEGLDLGEMDKKLLQKVEELTLYLIDMKKEINQLKAQNESLQQQINNHR